MTITNENDNKLESRLRKQMSMKRTNELDDNSYKHLFSRMKMPSLNLEDFSLKLK